MKKILYSVLGLSLMLSATSCDEFLSVKPIDKVAADTFLANEQEISLFESGMMDAYRPDASDIATGDNGTDLISKRDPAKYWFPNDIYKPSDRGVWSYKEIRRANVLLFGIEKAKDNISEEIYNHYAGVARFWRAYHIYSKVVTYGDLPWQEILIDPKDSVNLYGPREDREFVVHKCIEDLQFAMNNCLYGPDYKGHVNKYMAAAVLSRIALNEGTTRIYHDVNRSKMTPWTNQYETAQDLLRICIQASEFIMKSGEFALNANYAANFITEDLMNNPEMIWVAEYSTNPDKTVTHSLTSTFRGTNTIAPSPTKAYVNQFLNIDGTPITTDQIPLYEELAENNGRDPRLNATVNHIGHTYAANNGTTALKYMPCSLTPTGYNLIKYNIEEENQFNVAKCGNSIPILRYAEVLLNYAEAKAELGELTDTDWDMSIGALRKRAGMKGTGRPTVRDPRLYSYYADAYDYEEGTVQGNRANELKSRLTADIVEIRRERVCEMGYEGRRYNDLNRWHCLSIVPMRGTDGEGTKGIWVTKEDVKNGFIFNPTYFEKATDAKHAYKWDYILNSKGEYEYVGGDKGDFYMYHGLVTFTDGQASETNFCITTGGGEQSLSLSEGDHGYLIFHYPLAWDIKKYIYPVSVDVITKNPNIVQNYEWQ